MDPVSWAAIGSAVAGTAGTAAAGTAASSILWAPMGMTLAEAATAGIPLAADAAVTGAATAGAAGFNFARMFNVGSTIFNAGGALLSGITGKQEKDFEAKQLDQNAKAEVAAATRQMAVERRDTNLAESRVRNLAAASGGALDPSVINILGDLETEGTTNVQNTLYNANSRAAGMTNQAIASRFAGKNTMTAGGIGAVSSLFKGVGQSMSGKYGYDTSAGYG